MNILYTDTKKHMCFSYYALFSKTCVLDILAIKIAALQPKGLHVFTWHCIHRIIVITSNIAI